MCFKQLSLYWNTGIAMPWNNSNILESKAGFLCHASVYTSDLHQILFLPHIQLSTTTRKPDHLHLLKSSSFPSSLKENPSKSIIFAGSLLAKSKSHKK